MRRLKSISGYTSVPFNTTSATTDGLNNLGCGQGTANRDVWFSWVAPASEMVTVSTCGANYDSLIGIYNGTSCPATSVVTCNDDSCSLQSSASFSATAGASYLFRIGAFGANQSGSGTVTVASGGPMGGCPNPATGADVIVGSLNGISDYGSVGGVAAYSIGTTSCNVGDQELLWIANGTDHPVIGQNIYRIEDGRIEQIGLSWLKHGFTALQQDLCCDCASSGTGTRLGVGCSDPYGSGLNGSQGGLGPRFEVNAATGAFLWPYTADGQTGNAIYKRIQVPNSDMDPGQHPGAVYIGEAQYVAPDDTAAGNDNNNCSYAPISIGGFSGGSWNVSLGSTVREQPAIQAWQDTIPGVQLENVQVPGDGLFILGSHATDNGNGTWRYNYAVFNMNSDRSGQRLSIPVPPGVTVSNLGFNDVNYHSGEPWSGADWTSSMSGGSLTWSTQTEAQNPNANALRWGTMYTFWFDASSSPEPGQVTLGLFKSGAPGAMMVDADVPSGDATPFNYCQTSPNSATLGAVMDFTGSTSISANNFSLRTTDGVPNVFGLYFYGPNMIQAPFGDGFRCVGGQTFRIQPPAQFNGSGVVTRAVDFTSPPAGSGGGAITAGSSWNFQFWFRDPMGPGGNGFNLSDGLNASFIP